MEIFRLPALTDNYIFLLYDAASQTAAVVDPAQPEPVLQQLEQLGATLTAILNTHHHADHVGGNRRLLQQFPEAVVYGGTEDRGRIPGQQVFLSEGDTVTFAQAHGPGVFRAGAHPSAYCLLLSSD
jgi:hydroxyacylglutathione hydrolase